VLLLWSGHHSKLVNVYITSKKGLEEGLFDVDEVEEDKVEKGASWLCN
jgi:hypothetical protein